MDEMDKKILRAVQSHLPISSRPFHDLGQELGLDEEQVIARLEAMKKSGLIRRIGGNFSSNRIGFTSTLCAAKVPEDKFDDFVRRVNAYHGVTHNYRRNHDYNVWFTFIAETMDEIDRNLADIAEATGISDICSMPALETFKIKVDFPV